ncbi:hypothetical protein [Caproiciproducens faecalis]|uniref:Small, acid-soluble spore protein gamma-type n=1 Tax=Caproiciproducens faecalis TaxID=2820301 RepID=A0ABS7DJ37_9FIRM|nr:hypothetical protein [Caproiciproducens faecalis]MBW7571300.1 hypothetical protein [Caproiciproducens faecalis]
MFTEDKELNDAKKANQKAKQGNMSSYSNSTDPSLQETRQLNQQSATSGSSSSSSSYGTSSEEEAKQLNQKSRQNKSK